MELDPTRSKARSSNAATSFYPYPTTGPFADVRRRAWAWLWTTEGSIVICTALGHTLVHVLLMLLMPLAYYSELSGHDGDSYYALAYTPFPAQPAFALMRYKRIVFSLMARTVWPWDAHLGFAIIGIVGVVLANLYFYRIASLYTSTPLRVTLLFAFSPYLLAAAHVALPDPMSVALILAAFYYLLRNQFVGLTVCSAAALLFKEVAAVSILALAVLCVQRFGWQRTALYLALTAMPTLVVVGTYAVVWGDPLWYFKESRTTLIPAPLTLIGLLTNPSSTIMVRWSSMVNLGILALLGIALLRLRRLDRTLFIFVALSTLPLLFLDWRQYQSDFDMARQYMAAAPALLAFLGPLQRMRRWVLALLLSGMLCYSLYYTLSVSTFFVMHKAEIVQWVRSIPH